MSPRTKWLLLSDIHFKHADLNRITRTASWLTSLAQSHPIISRVVICGDLLTSRAVQSTHVLSACYRFIDALSEAVPRVNILLGNHDLAYKRDYTTTALNALNLRRLEPFITVHNAVEECVWDERRVLLLPFREEQGELTDAVDALGHEVASETVAFAHLAIHKAILQRHTISSITDLGSNDADGSGGWTVRPVTYRGLLGPQAFAPLARTFTGHFHSHQTILQPQRVSSANPLHGSITYIGSPLQLTWADALDEQRGAILLDPHTLEHELVVNPYAVGYATVHVQDVLDDTVDGDKIRDMHVMLLGELSHFRHVMARDKLLAAGARSVRRWEPARPKMRVGVGFGGLGATAPGGDVRAPKNNSSEPELELEDDPDDTEALGQVTQAGESQVNAADGEVKVEKLDMIQEAAKYVGNLKLDQSLEDRRIALVQVGQRLIHYADRDAGEEDDADVVLHAFLLNQNTAETSTTTAVQEKTAPVFVSRLRSLTITNFLGVQSTLTLDFTDNSILRGLIFLVGANGSGKSTIIEAIVWCQFGKCIRSGLSASDVVNEKSGRNCSVRLDFTNGYSITRYRKDKSFGNRVIVERDGVVETQYEGADARSTQLAIDELLGIDYDGFIRTVVLGHESTTSFLKTTPAERRDLIEEALGLGILDRSATVARRALKELDGIVLDLEYKKDAIEKAVQEIQRRIGDLQRLKAKAESEANHARTATAHLEKQHTAAQQLVKGLLDARRATDVRRAFDQAVLALDQQLTETEQRLEESRTRYALTAQSLQHPKPSPPTDAPALKDRILQALCSLKERVKRWASQDSLSQENTSIGPGQWKQSVVNFALEAVQWTMEKLFGLNSKKAQERSEQEKSHRYNLLSQAFNDDIARYESELTALQSASAEGAIIFRLSKQLNLEEQYIHDIIHTKNTEEAQIVPQRLEEAMQRQLQLQQERASLTQEVQKEYQAMTYTDLIHDEDRALNQAEKEKSELETRLAALSADRDVFAFWVSSLMKKTARKSSSRGSDPAVPMTFREYVLSRRLADLNNLTAQILTDLFDDVDQSNTVARSMLHSLFTSSQSFDATDSNEMPDATVLDPTLSIASSLAYAKRSGGERKRMDLALFFALFQIAQAQSAHRARYALVDEVFDSLDEAGQRAVVRWCRGLVGPWGGLDLVVVITHSDFMVRAAGDGEGGLVVVEAEGRATGGTRLVVDGVEIGGVS